MRIVSYNMTNNVDRTVSLPTLGVTISTLT